MSTDEFQNMWKSYDDKLDRSLKLNLRLLETMQSEKVRSSFRNLIRSKIAIIVFGILWNIFIALLIFAYHSEPFFVVSAVLLIFFCTVAIAGYIRQITIIRQIDLGASITETQTKLTLLQASIIRDLRFQFLQAPIYSVFFIRVRDYEHVGATIWIIQIGVTTLLTLAGIWLYRNISFKNLGKKWVKSLVQNEGGKSITRAMAFIREIEEFKNS